MPFQDALLHIATYPDPTSEAAIEQYHREFKRTTWLEVNRLELLVDLSS